MFIKIKPDVLKEQEAGKSWYRDADNECDLFLWQDETGNLKRFQLWQKNRLLEWDEQNGYKSGNLDTEEGSFKSYQSPSYHYHPKFNIGFAIEMMEFFKEQQVPEEEHILFSDIMRKIQRFISLRVTE